MSNLDELDRELRIMIADTATSAEARSARICDDLLLRYADIYAANASFKAIGDMCIKIKTSKATEGENGVMWAEVVRLVHKMLDA